MRLLVSRTDRLGDVLLSLPALLYLKEVFPQSAISFLIKKELGPVLQSFAQANRITLETVESFALKRGVWEGVLFLDSYFSLARESFLKCIPVRGGTLSKPWSFLFLNQGVRQKRSLAEKNEAQYSLELARTFASHWCLHPPEFTNSRAHLPTTALSAANAHDELKKRGILANEPFILVHPGMGGSALNLSAERYTQAVARMERTFSCAIILSVGPAQSDRELKKEILENLPHLKILEGVGLETLREVFRLASWVIAPSTGPLHLAHSVGTRTISLFSPVRSHQARRWRPFGEQPFHRVITPSVDCPGTQDCLGQACQHFNCMETTPWPDEIVSAMKERNG